MLRLRLLHKPLEGARRQCKLPRRAISHAQRLLPVCRRGHERLGIVLIAAALCIANRTAAAPPHLHSHPVQVGLTDRFDRAVHKELD